MVSSFAPQLVLKKLRLPSSGCFCSQVLSAMADFSFLSLSQIGAFMS